MKQVNSVTITDTTAIDLLNQLAGMEERRPTDSATRLFIKSARAKIARMRRKKK